MIKKLIFKLRLKASIILLIILMTSIYMNISTDFFNETSNSEKISDDGDGITDFNPTEPTGELKSSALGNDTWWNYDFQYRRLINVTNPYSVNFTNYGVSVSFNYAELVQAGKMQADLDDIRIVENEIPRNYYVAQDYPQLDYATVYFDTNVSQVTTEKDTYLYFGNNTVGKGNTEGSDPSVSFGWVKNGDFELDIDSSDNFNPYGWNWTHEPINSMQGKNIWVQDESYNSPDSLDRFVNKLIEKPAQGGDRVWQGDYAYKFGSPQTILHDSVCHEYAGTFFSYPFTVPMVKGDDIFLRLYRNVRTWIFEEKPTTIDTDGYFTRFCNGSSYSDNPDEHEDIDPIDFTNYIEAYGGKADKPGPFWKWETELQEHFHEIPPKNTYSDTSQDGELTCPSSPTPIPIYVNMTRYMGKEIFFEFGVWGNELDIKSAFFQLDDIRFNYTLTASIDEVQAYNSTVIIIPKDVDGRLVPNAKIAIVNNSAKGTEDYIVKIGTSTYGSITFTDVPNGWYNITANYTLGSLEKEVFNSIKAGTGPYYFNGINYTKEIQLNLWTIDFEIVDWDGIPLSLGYIEVNESKGGNLLATLPLDSNGKATFRWENTSMYYYKVYYKNDDYYGDFSPIALNESFIYRTSYDKNNEKYQNHTLYVNETNKAPQGDQRYLIHERIYTNRSRVIFGNKKIIKVNITLTDMTTKLTNVSIYYIDKNNLTGSGNENLIYFEEGYGDFEESDFIPIDIMRVDNDKLKSENYEAYGLLIVINGANNSQCNGIVKIDLIETCNVYNKTELARINIQTIYISPADPQGAPVSALVKVVETGKPLINLTSDKNYPDLGRAYGQINKIPFLYLRGRVYNFSIDIVNITNVDFNITKLDPNPESQWYPRSDDGTKRYNFTLYRNVTLIFNIILKGTGVNITQYDTIFYNASGTGEVFWSENMTFWVNFTSTSDGGIIWQIVTPPAYCILTIKLADSDEILIIEQMVYMGDGNFTKTINSSRLSAGNNQKYYYIEVNGYHPTYTNPNTQLFLVKLKAIPTSIASYNYDSRLLLTSNLYSQNYAELVNITIAYNISETGKPLDGATVAYTWDFGSGTLEPDQVWTDFYTMTLNTSDALSTGIKIITITASFENYSSAPITIYLNVLKRATTLNGQTGLVYSNPKIWVQDAHYYNFTYSDSKTTDIIGDLQIAVYSWQLLDSSGNPIIGKSGSGTLSQNADKIYTLDFNTGIKPLGYYQLYITLGKENYEERFALINLEIKLREFDADLDATDLEDDKVSIVKGNNIEFEIELFDETRGNIPLTGAKVVLEIGDKEYEFDEDDPGIYTYTFSTEEIDAFYTSQTFTGQIIIKKVNFTSEEIDITIVVEMEEIFDGMPTFYFILLVAIIGGIIGSLVSYRVIQQARIPGFVKKIRKVKNTIKAKKPITESYSIPTIEQMILKQFGPDWKAIGFSLEDNLGIKDLKSKSSTEENKITKVRGENN